MRGTRIPSRCFGTKFRSGNELWFFEKFTVQKSYNRFGKLGILGLLGIRKINNLRIINTPCKTDPDQVHQNPINAPRLHLSKSAHAKVLYGSAEEPLIRLEEHQRGQTISTRGHEPWALVHQEQFYTLVRGSSARASIKKLEFTSFNPAAD